MCSANSWPVTDPTPLTRLKTPSGKPTEARISVKRRVDRGVFSAALKTIEQPAARAGATFLFECERCGCDASNLPGHHEAASGSAQVKKLRRLTEGSSTVTKVSERHLGSATYRHDLSDDANRDLHDRTVLVGRVDCADSHHAFKRAGKTRTFNGGTMDLVCRTAGHNIRQHFLIERAHAK